MLAMTIDTKRNVTGIYNQRRSGPCFRNIRGNLKILIAFLLGILIGRFGQSNKCSDATTSSRRANFTTLGTLKSSVKHLNDIPVRNTSHINKKTGNVITKQQFLDPFLVPNVAGVSIARIGVGEAVEMHSHRNMHEFFYVLEGTATFFMNDNNGQRQGRRGDPGTFAHFVPNCAHGILVADNSTRGDLKVLVVGVTVGE